MIPYLLHHFLSAAAERKPEQVCLVHDRVRSSYADIENNARRTAGVLIEQGLRRGDRVALLSFNSRFFVESYFGILRAGGIVVPLNTGVEPRQISFFLADCGATALILGRGTERMSQGALHGLSDLRVVLTEGPPSLLDLPSELRTMDLEEAKTAHVGTGPQAKIIDLDTACIIYTSGSTGRPRGVTLTHLNCVANASAVLGYLKLTPDDRVLAVLPFYYIYGKSVLDTHIAAGATVVIENRFLYPETALNTLASEECTGLSGVPSTFGILLNRSTFAERRFTHLRYVTQAGGAMSPALTRRLLEVLPDKEIFVMYGATEAAGRLAYLPPGELRGAVGCIGRAIDNVELLVLRPDGTVCDVGETGEIVARGSCLMSGYWNDPEETQGVLDGHGYHTGDLAQLRPDGNLAIVGRKRDMIKSGAHRIAAKEIEDVILESPDVHEAAVVGAPDEILGEAIYAYVVPKSQQISAEALRVFLGERLPAHKLPAVINVRRHLPKNEAGKIMKETLRQEALAAACSCPSSLVGRL